MDFFIYDNVPRTDPDDRRDGSLPSESVLPSFFNSIVGFEATDATAVDGTRVEWSLKIGGARVV